MAACMLDLNSRWELTSSISCRRLAVSSELSCVCRILRFLISTTYLSMSAWKSSNVFETILPSSKQDLWKQTLILWLTRQLSGSAGSVVTFITSSTWNAVQKGTSNVLLWLLTSSPSVSEYFSDWIFCSFTRDLNGTPVTFVVVKISRVCPKSSLAVHLVIDVSMSPRLG